MLRDRWNELIGSDEELTIRSDPQFGRAGFSEEAGTNYSYPVAHRGGETLAILGQLAPRSEDEIGTAALVWNFRATDGSSAGLDGDVIQTALQTFIVAVHPRLAPEDAEPVLSQLDLDGLEPRFLGVDRTVEYDGLAYRLVDGGGAVYLIARPL